MARSCSMRGAARSERGWRGRGGGGGGGGGDGEGFSGPVQRRPLVATAAVTTPATTSFKQCRLIDVLGQSILTSLAELGDGAAGRAGDLGKIRAF